MCILKSAVGVPCTQYTISLLPVSADDHKGLCARVYRPLQYTLQVTPTSSHTGLACRHAARSSGHILLQQRGWLNLGLPSTLQAVYVMLTVHEGVPACRMTSSATHKQLLLVVHRCRICWPLYEQSFMVRRQAWAQVLSLDQLLTAFLAFI